MSAPDAPAGGPCAGRRLALFDLDGTLLCGPSAERRFAAWLFSRRHAGVRQAFGWLGYALSHLAGDGRDVLRRDKGYVVGLEVARVADLAAEHVGSVLAAGSIDPGVRRALEEHRSAGDDVVLLSGTLQPLADAWAARLGCRRGVGSLAPTLGTRYVAGPPERHPYGRAKRELAERLAAETGAGAVRAVAYADSIADRELLEWAGEPVAVEPDAALAALARARGWRVLRHVRGADGARDALGRPPSSDAGAPDQPSGVSS